MNNTIKYNSTQLKISFPTQHIYFTFTTVSRLVLSRGHFCYFNSIKTFVSRDKVNSQWTSKYPKEVRHYIGL